MITLAEYAVLDVSGRSVMNIVASNEGIERVRALFPDYVVRPVEEVPESALRNYPYWVERP